MKIGLVLEGGAMRGMYTAGVLDVFDEKAYEESKTDFYATITNVETGKPEYIKVENVLEQMELLRATSAMPYVSEMIEVNGKKYLDGGISDSIPINKCKELGFEKIIVILTRPIEYRKKKSNHSIAKIKYFKYPNLVNAINSRYKNYNDTVEKIIDIENKKEIFVIRPSKKIKIKRIERDAEKLQEMYDLGVSDCKNKLQDLKDYLNKI